MIERFAVAVAAALLVVASWAQAQPGDERAETLRALFGAGAGPEMFAEPGFWPQVEPVLRDLTGRFGEPQQVVPAGEGRLRLDFADVAVEVDLALDAEGRITGLWFHPPRVAVARAPEEIVAEVAAFPGRASLLVLRDGRTAAEFEPQARLAVGSAFKLGILAALVEEIEAGRRAWSDTVTLEPRDRSLPTGLAQDWPAGLSVTLDTLATLMLAYSDNTATDALIRVLGREAVAAQLALPDELPLLTTREAFQLKADEGLARAWAEGGRAEREAVIEALDAIGLPRVADLPSGVAAAEAEWFVPAGRLCTLLDRTAAYRGFAVNPGLALPADWSAIAYKGGSEPGVLNLSTRVVAADGTAWCVIATWNDAEPLDETALFELYGELLQALAEMD